MCYSLFKKWKGSKSSLSTKFVRVFGQGLSSCARGRSQLCPSVLRTYNLQSGVLSMQGPSRIRLRHLGWSLTSYKYARAFLYFPPTYANHTTRGVGIQVSGWSRDWVSVRPFFLPTMTPLPHNQMHCSPVAELQWSYCAVELAREMSTPHVRLS